MQSPIFEKKYWFGDIRQKVSKLALLGWLVGSAVFSEMALRIFLMFCMKFGDYKGRKVTEPDFWKKKKIDLEIFVKRSPNYHSLLAWLVGWLVGNAVFSEMSLRIFLLFCMKLGDYKGRKVTPRFLKKVLDLEIFAKSFPN